MIWPDSQILEDEAVLRTSDPPHLPKKREKIPGLGGECRFYPPQTAISLVLIDINAGLYVIFFLQWLQWVRRELLSLRSVFVWGFRFGNSALDGDLWLSDFFVVLLFR